MIESWTVGQAGLMTSQSRLVPPRNVQRERDWIWVLTLERQLHLGQMLERELDLGLLGILLDCEERGQLPTRVFCKATISSSSLVQQVQDLSLFSKPQKAATTPPPYGEVDEEVLASTYPCAPTIPLYPSTTFTIHRTSLRGHGHCKCCSSLCTIFFS